MSHISMHEEVVQEAWIDYNGHMNVAFYVLVFDHATDVLFDQFGFDAAYREKEQKSIFIIESHVTYEHELVIGERILVKSWLLGLDEKRLHIYHEMYHKEKKIKCATNEIMALHVDINMRKTAPISLESQLKLQSFVEASLIKGWPEGCGRSIGTISGVIKK
jgi:acyl-CoA thioester hydrolase